MSTPGSSTHSKGSKRNWGLSALKGKEIAAEVSGALVTTLTILEKSLDGVPVPGLKAAVGGVLEVIKTVDKAKGNAKDIEELRNNVNRLIESVIEPVKEAKMTPALETRIDALTRDLQKIEMDYRKMSEKGRVRQFLAVHDHATTISGLHRMLNQAIQTFLTGTVIEIEKRVVAIDARGEVILEEAQHAGKQVEIIHRGVERLILSQAEQELLNRLPHVDARFDAASRSMAPSCLKDTRAALLAEIFDWINGPITEKKIYWLHGLAGTGKSTIAHTVAERLAGQGHLGASFFFSRDVEDRRDALRVLPTIAHQLAEFSPEFKKHLVAELEERNDAGTAMLSVQVQRLLTNPLKSMSSASTSTLSLTSPIVVVMDALDECEHQTLVTSLLKLLSEVMRSLPDISFKIFITSRPEQHIVDTFGENSTTQISRPFVLHDIETKIVKADIESYLRHELSVVAREFRLSKSSAIWPSPDELIKLVDRAGALFIVASTGIKFIADPDVREPKHQLQVLLSDKHVSGQSPYSQLDDVYYTVLKASVGRDAKRDDRACVRFRDVVGAILMVRDPLSPASLQFLLGCNIEYVTAALVRLRSVIIIPSDLESSPEPLRVFHLSFPNFLTERCSDPCFSIDPVLHHRKLALHCLLLLNSFLPRDVCQLPKALQLNAEITDLEETLRNVVLPHHRYACQQWGFHLQGLFEATKARGIIPHIGPESPDNILNELLAAFCIFCEEKLLQWIEVLSLLGQLDVAIPMLKAAEIWLKSINQSHPMLRMLNDGQRLLLQYFEPIKLGASQIYHSALAFMPNCMLYEQYKSELHSSVRLIRGRETSWNPCMRTMLGHTHYVRSVAFSHDSNFIASGSNDETVCIWDTATGSLVKQLEGHTHYVRSVAFSHDSNLIASGSDDKTVCIWDTATGSLVKQLEGHTDYVRSVAFSHDSTYIITHDFLGHCICWNSKSLTRITTGPVITSEPGKTNSCHFNIHGQWVQVLADGSPKLCYLPLPSSNIICHKIIQDCLVFGTKTGAVYVLKFSQMFLATLL